MPMFMAETDGTVYYVETPSSHGKLAAPEQPEDVYLVGPRGSAATLDLAAMGALLPSLNAYVNSGVVVPVSVTNRYGEITRVTEDTSWYNRSPPFGDGKPVRRWALRHGGHITPWSPVQARELRDYLTQLLAVGPQADEAAAAEE